MQHVAVPPPGSVGSSYTSDAGALQRRARDLPPHLPHRAQRAAGLLPDPAPPQVPALARLLPVLRPLLAAFLPAAPGEAVQRRAQGQLQDCAAAGPGAARGSGQLLPEAQPHPLRHHEGGGHPQRQHRRVEQRRPAGLQTNGPRQRYRAEAAAPTLN